MIAKFAGRATYSTCTMNTTARLRFRPHPLLRGGHAQTLSGWLLSHAPIPYTAQQRHVTLSDGDCLVLHDDCPAGWCDGAPTALLVHGLGGCHQSNYMVRTAAKLNSHGVRTFRIDLRGCGAGMSLARRTYHAGRSEDLVDALEWIAQQCPKSPTVLAGYSLGGSIALKMLGVCGANPPGNLTHAIVACPPVDLSFCAQAIRRPSRRLYQHYLVLSILQQIEERRRLLPDLEHPELPGRLVGMIELDDAFTAPVNGFASAEDYYRRSSAAQFLPDIRVPTMVLASRDDPMVPVATYEAARFSPSTHFVMTDHGGHMGFIAPSGLDPDRRWLDWRVVEWTLGGGGA